MYKKTLLLLLIPLFLTACTMSPEEHAELAFRKYALECVARGIPENTQKHTDCVVNKYKNFTQEKDNTVKEMRTVFADSDTNKQ